MKTEYHLLKIYQYYFVFFALAPYIIYVIFMCRAVYDFWGLCFVLPPILFVIIGILTNFQKILSRPYQRIILSEQGIEYAKPYLAFETKWGDAGKIGKRWSFMGRLEGLIIEQSKINITVGNNWEFLSLFKKVFVPLSCFSENWRDSELGQQIKQYAPHLFQQPK